MRCIGVTLRRAKLSVYSRTEVIRAFAECGAMQNESEISRLNDELNAGSEQIRTLESELETCRKETLRLRSKAASVAVSFEGLKDELQAILQSEAGLMTTPDDDNQLVQSPSKENATLCTLGGQLEATETSVEEAVRERDELLRQMSEEETIHVEEATRDEPSVPLFGSAPDAGEEYVAMNLMEKLNAQAATTSSFRDDHARIWRDHTLPNVALLQYEQANNGTMTPHSASCGVVAERLFAGITLYTSTNSEGEVEDHCYLSSCGEAKEVTEQEFNVVKDQYCSLLVEDPSMAPHKIKIIAPRQAIDRVIQLIKSAETRALPLPRVALDGNTSATVADGEDIDKADVKRDNSPPTTRRKRPGPRLSTTSHVLQPEHFQFLVNECIPIRFQECDLLLKYSTNNNGMSVHTLYELVQNVSPTIVAIRDTQDRVFGCYAASAWKSCATRYYGTGECFVFSCKPRLAVYKWNRINHFFQFSQGNVLAMGGGTGSHYALWVDEDLVAGATAMCTTFDSPPLTLKSGETAERDDFSIVTLEVWTVVPRSHALFTN